MAGPNSRRARAARRRTRRVKAAVNDLTAEQWAALKRGTAAPVQGQPGQTCSATASCRYPAAAVHRRQRRAACAACNASKCNDEVTGWMRRKRLDERAFLERLCGDQGREIAADITRMALTRPSIRPPSF